MKAYHFLKGQDHPVLRDGTPLKLHHTYRHEGSLVLCEKGYHASVRAIDALSYAPGNWISIVECSGEIIHGDDKLVCRERTAIRVFNGEKLLREFARKQALSVIDKWDAPEVVRKYLETGDESLRSAAESAAGRAAHSAAHSAAWSAARSAARSVAWSAAWSAAYSAAWSAAYSAARSVAWSAARSAAWSAARSVAWSAARRAAHSAAESAASAAEGVAHSASNDMLEKMIAKEG